LLAAIPILAVAVIWLPIGHSMTGLIEEWGLLGSFTKGGLFFFAVDGTPMASQKLRPLTILPQALAYLADPNGFGAWHIIQACALGLKGLAMLSILRWLTHNSWIAAAGAAIFVLYPADTMQMSFRSLHINVAVAAVLLGIAATLYATAATNAKKYIYASAGGALFLFASLTYEAAFFLAPAPLLLSFGRYGFRRTILDLRALAPVALVWLLFVAAAASYAFDVSRSPDLYQQSVAGDTSATLRSIASRLPLLVSIAGYRAVLQCWFDAARMGLDHLAFLGLALVAAILIAASGYFAYRSEAPSVTGRTYSASGMALASILLIALGYLPYLSSPSHILITQRTYLFASFGATLLLVLLLVETWRYQRWICILLVAGATGLGLISQWTQFQHYADLSFRQARILSGILSATRSTPDRDLKLLVLDQSGSLDNTWMLRGQILEGALTYLARQPVSAVVCVEPSLTLSSFRTDSNYHLGQCSRSEDGWQVTIDTESTDYPDKGVQELVIGPDLTVVRQSPESGTQRLDLTRARAALPCWTTNCPNSLLQTSAGFQYDFGRYWSLEEAPMGGGWNDAEWDPPSWEPQSSAWMHAPRAAMWFMLSSQRGKYRLQVRLRAFTSAEAKARLAVRLNDVLVATHWENETTLTAEVDGATLQAGLNRIEFDDAASDPAGLSASFDRIELLPIGAS
jgi:hypothetical protein